MYSWRIDRPLDKEEIALLITSIETTLLIASMIAGYFIVCALAPR